MRKCHKLLRWAWEIRMTWCSALLFLSAFVYFLTSFPSRSDVFLWCLRESWMAWICMETADSTASSKRLNSSKQPHAPHFTNPTKIRPIDFTSIPWKTDQKKSSRCHLYSICNPTLFVHVCGLIKRLVYVCVYYCTYVIHGYIVSTSLVVAFALYIFFAFHRSIYTPRHSWTPALDVQTALLRLWRTPSCLCRLAHKDSPRAPSSLPGSESGSIYQSVECAPA